MNFSRECEYAVRGMVALAGEPRGQALTLQEVAAGHNLPPGFLSKIFQKLVRHGLIQSHRGVQRGYTLAHPAPEITLRQILEAIEGPDLFDRCVFSHRPCMGEENPCLLHKAWQDLRPQVQAAFERTTLQDVVEARKTVSPPPAAARRARARHA